MIHLLALFIVIMSIVNLIRMMIYLVGSDIYAVRHHRVGKTNLTKTAYRPSVSLIVPAHNEASVITQTLECLLKLEYPTNKLQIIIANDGSTDDTADIVSKFIEAHPYRNNFVLYSQANGGKADVMNNAIINQATGNLIMCLDADSLIAADGIQKAVEYFRDPKVVALASNVNILENGTILGMAQRFEYLISYHMKKAQTVYNIEYIIGGIGSMFRRSILDKVGLYDTNTMTEDIDLTMKIIALGNKKYKVAYAADCLTYTEAVPSFKSLIVQRFRWKYGRMQTFLKNSDVFFSTNRDHSKQLTWLMLPYSLLQELLFLIEPLVVTFILFVSIYYHDPVSILIALTVITGYILVNIWSTAHLTKAEKLRLSFISPTMYVLLYLLSVVEYAALMKAIIKLPELRRSISGTETTTWVSPERSGAASKAVV